MKKDGIVLRYDDPDFETKKENLENRGYHACLWTPSAIGFSPKQHSVMEKIKKCADVLKKY